VIAAAGSGERLGAGGPKAFVEVAGRPLLAWSLAAFAAAESIGKVVIAAPPDEVGRTLEVADQAGAQVSVVPGGEHRSQSVAAAMAEVDSELVAVHDAARPLATAALIDSCVQRLAANPEVDGVIAAVPVPDTIKEASMSRRVLRTPDRTRLWAAQTPQAFRSERLREALAVPSGELAAATDDAMLVERAGGEVLLQESPTVNFKVTTPIDLTVAGLLLAQQIRE
jgi:2-C-methyl-D-erythritol 4-phosphate cytidylyltransferase